MAARAGLTRDPAQRSLEKVQSDFDEIARLAGPGESGHDRYDAYLLSLIPSGASRVLDAGCGMGRLTWALDRADRDVVGVDLSPVMIERARGAGRSPRVSFLQGDCLSMDLGDGFDCVVSAAALHHLDQDAAVARLAGLVRPGGRLIIQDLRRDAGMFDLLRSSIALAHALCLRLVQTGWPVSSWRVRRAWARHGKGERYLSLAEARTLAARHLPGSTVTNHCLWRYTIVWDKPRSRREAS